MTGKKSTHVSEAKKKTVVELAELIKTNKTVLIASIKNIPGSQFQEIVKNLRGKALVKVPKKSLIIRAIDVADGTELEKIKDKIDSDIAILFSNLDVFELAGELIKSKRPAKAKPGQEAPEDIEIPEGGTELVPGPAISELGALGIQIQIEKGKIHIKKSKIIVKKGGKISKGSAEIMGKLNIKPFSIGFIPLCAFDNQDKKFYSEINIDPEKTIEDIKQAFGKALPFAIEIGFATQDTITFMIGKAGMHEKAITHTHRETLKNENKEEPVKEEKAVEEKVDDKNAANADDKVTDNKETLEVANDEAGLNNKNSEGGGGVDGGESQTETQENKIQEENK